MISATTTTSPPIVGNPHTSYAGQEWVAAFGVFALIVVVFLVRRFCAARNVGLDIGASFLWVFGHPAPVGAQAPDARGLLVGMDNRVSTSKTTAALWTVVLLYLHRRDGSDPRL